MAIDLPNPYALETARFTGEQNIVRIDTRGEYQGLYTYAEAGRQHNLQVMNNIAKGVGMGQAIGDGINMSKGNTNLKSFMDAAEQGMHAGNYDNGSAPDTPTNESMFGKSEVMGIMGSFLRDYNNGR